MTNCKHSPLINIPLAHYELINNQHMGQLYDPNRSRCAICGVELFASWSASDKIQNSEITDAKELRKLSAYLGDNYVSAYGDTANWAIETLKRIDRRIIDIEAENKALRE